MIHVLVFTPTGAMLTLPLLLYALRSVGFMLCWEMVCAEFSASFAGRIMMSKSITLSMIHFRLFFMCLIKHFIPFFSWTGLQFHMLHSISVLPLHLLNHILWRSVFQWGIRGELCSAPRTTLHPISRGSTPLRNSGLHLTKLLLLHQSCLSLHCVFITDIFWAE